MATEAIQTIYVWQGTDKNGNKTKGEIQGSSQASEGETENESVALPSPESDGTEQASDSDEDCDMGDGIYVRGDHYKKLIVTMVATRAYRFL